MTTGIKIVATIMAKPEYRQELLGCFQPLIQASREEAGNLSYDLHEALDNPNRLVFIEHWQSQAAIDEHNASEHFQTFVKAIEGKTDSVEITLLQEIDFPTN
ncbi:MAG: putative quinol monooxygenase [Neisseria sp.]|nr:putative quinol monooxygenase [Neisseria sp.]